MPDSTTHTSPRGKRLVATLLTIGIVAGIVAVCYWKWGVRVDADALKRDIAALESKIETMRAAPNLDNEAKLQIDQLVLERNRLQALLDKALPAGQKALDADLATKELAQLEDDFAQAKQVRRIKPMIARCEAFVAKYPAYPPAYTMLAKVYIELYDWPTALELLMKSLKLDPQQPMVHHLAGTVHYEMKQYEQAEQHYLSARTLSPKDPLHMVYLAQVYIRTGKQDAAMVELLRALDLNSQFHEAYATMSDLYMHQNDATRALQQIDKALKFVSQEKREIVVPYRRKRAAVLRRMGEPDAAMQEFVENLHDAEQFYPENAEDIATTWGMLGQPAKAVELYERAITANPTESRLIEGMIAWQLKVNNTGKARQYLRQLKGLDPHLKIIATLEERIGAAEAKAKEPQKQP